MAQRIAIYVVGRGDIQKVDPYRYPRECYIESFRIIDLLQKSYSAT